MRARVEKNSAFCPLLKVTQMGGARGGERRMLILMSWNVKVCSSVFDRLGRKQTSSLMRVDYLTGNWKWDVGFQRPVSPLGDALKN